jgi:MFS family permease
LEPAGRFPPHPRIVTTRRTEAGALSPIESLYPAWDATLRLLLRPFDRRRWIALSLVCLFLGGGTSTAAFQWGYGALPGDLRPSDLLLRARLVMAQHSSLIVLAMVFSLGLVLGLTYARCMFRFVLIDAVIKQEVAVGAAWKSLKAFGRSYFFWLLGVVGAALVMVSGAAIFSLRYLALLREVDRPWWVASLLIVTELVAVVFIGLAIAILITLTDDLVAPMMYADRISLPAAWRIFWKITRRERETLIFYVVLRFAVGMGISLAVLFVLFPVLTGVSSGALVTAALGLLALHAVGLAWAWNPLTITLGALALFIFTLLLFVLLGVVGMPGQVYLQNYGVRFIASRVPSLGALCRASSAARRWR